MTYNVFGGLLNLTQSIVIVLSVSDMPLSLWTYAAINYGDNSLRECCSCHVLQPVNYVVACHQHCAEIVSCLWASSDDLGWQLGSWSVADCKSRGLMWPDPMVEVGQTASLTCPVMTPINCLILHVIRHIGWPASETDWKRFCLMPTHSIAFAASVWILATQVRLVWNYNPYCYYFYYCE